MNQTRAQIEKTIVASLITAPESVRPKFAAEMTDLTPECFSVPMFREIFKAYIAGKLEDHPITVRTWHDMLDQWTIPIHMRWYCLELLKAIKEGGK